MVTGESITLFQQENKLEQQDIFIRSENKCIFPIIIFIIIRFFSRKQKKMSKVLLFYCFLVFDSYFKFSIDRWFSFQFFTLTKMFKNDFFNLETLTFCHHIQHITLHKKSYYFWQY